MPRRVLVVDDDLLFGKALARHLEGFTVECVTTLAAAREALCRPRTVFRAVLLDMHLDGENGFDLLPLIESRPGHPRTIIVSGDCSAPAIIDAFRRGAVDFLPKPFAKAELVEAIERAGIPVPTVGRIARSRTQVGAWRAAHVPAFIGSSPSIERVFDLLCRAADVDCPVLITGESGSGKEIIARGLHNASPHAGGPFVAVNCAAVPEQLFESELFGHVRGAFTGAQQANIGKFAAADGGTLLLDEIGEMPLSLQAKLLRVLQDGEVTPVGETRARSVNVRVIASTNRNLEEMAAAGQFRADLYYRLNVLAVELPPLRARTTDIPELLVHFVEKANRRYGCEVAGFDVAAVDMLANYRWPGNVRQLENTVDRLVVTRGVGVIGVEDLPEGVRRQSAAAPSNEPVIAAVRDLPEDGLDLRELVGDFEASLIAQALVRVGGNRNRAAAMLGINRTTLVEKLRKRPAIAQLKAGGM